MSIDRLRSRLSITSTIPPLATAVDTRVRVVVLIPMTRQKRVGFTTVPVTCIVSLIAPDASSDADRQNLNVLLVAESVPVLQVEVTPLTVSVNSLPSVPT